LATSPVTTLISDLQELVGMAEPTEFSLSDIHGFPESEWHSRRMLYDEYEAWFSGEKLEEKQTQGGRTVDKYPIKLNPIRGAVYKHAYALWGETKSDSRPLAPLSLHPDDRTDKPLAQNGQNYINRIWYENSGRSILMRNGILSQILGGSVIKLSYVPEQSWRRIPIRIESIHPGNFVGVPMAGDEVRLEQAWIVKAISPYEANRLYGMEFPEDELVYYVEYWTPDEYEITLNGKIITSSKVDPDSGERLPYAGKNRWKSVPVTYVPHIRTNDFYGDSLISTNVQGIVEELNARVADYGDAVTDDAHKYHVITGTSGRPDVYELAPGMRVIQLPVTPAITGKETEGNMDVLGTGAASSAMLGLTDELYDHFRREAFVPAVADGEDEGSQRSSLTLAIRMWPLFSHTSMERVFWGDALSIVDGMLLSMSSTLPSEFSARDWKKMLDMRIERNWSPVLPKDREVFINELVSRASTKLGSLKHLLSLIDDVEDPDGEYEEIKKQLQEFADIDTQIQQERAEANAEIQSKNEAKEVKPKPADNKPKNGGTNAKR